MFDGLRDWLSRHLGRAAGPGRGVPARQMRVFISSTFRDMQANREVLVKQIFPKLRKLCESRGVVWGEVDLRWGITDEERAEGKVLPICLAEIDNCRPYFIGLLGERYGSKPKEIPAGLLKLEPWLRCNRSRSVTELEILHGVLRNPRMARHAYFYFRDPAYVDSISDKPRTDFTAESEEAARKLRQLKSRIAHSTFPVCRYPNPKELGQLVLRDFTALIERSYPVGSQPHPLDGERFDHETFAASRRRVYIGREEDFEKLDRHVAADGPPLAVLGEPGSGKSALLANWAARYREAHPDAALIQHFTGAAPNSADWKEVVRRLLAEFDRRLGVKVPVPDQPAALRAAFANALHMAAASSRAIILLDGLNQMEDADGATELAWLPEQVPPRLRFILSTVSGPVFDEIERRKWPILEVRPLDVPERLRLIRQYLFQYRKHLAAAEETEISAAQQTASPLFLSALLEELRLFGSYEALGARIEEYLRAPDAVVLYEKILARYEEDYERDRGGLVRDAMSLIWAARRGLSEAELLELLGNSEDPLAGAIWSPLFLAAEAGLIVRSGLIAFSHDYLRQAVARRYLGDAAAKVAAHARLVWYFRERPRGFRRTDELPWQMARTGEWHSLADYLAGPAALRDTWERSEFDARAYWADVEKSSPYRRSTVYASVAADPVQDLDHAWKVGLLLGDSGSRRQALELRQRLSCYFRAHDRRAALAANLGIEGNLHYVLGEFDQALALHTERERLYRALDEPERLAAALGDRALVLMDMGQADEALRLFREEERICRQFGSERGLQASLGNQALVLKRQGKHDEACKLLREQETICRRLIDRIALSNCLGNQGELHYDCKEHKAALRLLRQQKRIASELGYLPGLVRSLGDQALTQSALGKYRSALTLHAREQRLAETLEDPAAIAVSLANQAHLRGVKLNRKTEALQLLDQAFALAEKHGIQALCDQILETRSKIE